MARIVITGVMQAVMTKCARAETPAFSVRFSELAKTMPLALIVESELRSEREVPCGASYSLQLHDIYVKFISC